MPKIIKISIIVSYFLFSSGASQQVHVGYQSACVLCVGAAPVCHTCIMQKLLCMCYVMTVMVFRALGLMVFNVWLAGEEGVLEGGHQFCNLPTCLPVLVYSTTEIWWHNDEHLFYFMWSHCLLGLLPHQ